MKVPIMITVVAIIILFTIASFIATSTIIKHRNSKFCMAHPDNEAEVQKLESQKVDFGTKTKILAMMTLYRNTYNAQHASNTLAAMQ